MAGRGNRTAEVRPIRDGEVYTLEDFKLAAGLKEAAMREARRAGLQVIRAHNRGFVTGKAWLAYLEGIASTQAGEADSGSARNSREVSP